MRSAEGANMESNMADNESARPERGMTMKEEIRKAQKERSERTKILVQAWFKASRLPEPLLRKRHRNPSTFDELSTVDE